MMKNIDNKILTELCDKARSSPRRRAHLNLHPELDDPVQRLVVAVEPDSYIQPHRHTESGKWELLIVIKGCFQVLIFDHTGTILDKQTLSSTDQLSRIIEIPESTWHCITALEPGSIFFETKPGPYTVLTDKDFASWAPGEQANGVDKFLSWLKAAKIGDSALEMNK